MDPIKNPFVPGAGSPPPELAGRGAIIEKGRILIERTKQGIQGRNFILTGLRGVGKTVLLVEMERMAEEAGFNIVRIEAQEELSIKTEMARELRRILLGMSALSTAGHKIKHSLAVLKSFVSAFKISVGDFSVEVQPEHGAADSEDIENDLPILLLAAAEAAKENGHHIAIIIDEIHTLSMPELKGLIISMHRIQQKNLPLIFMGAGLPTILQRAGNALTYAERLFDYLPIGPLSEADTRYAVSEPAERCGVVFEDEALDEIYYRTLGYPYFIQTWGHQAWDIAAVSPIGKEVIDAATRSSVMELDQGFFRVRFDRLTQREKEYLFSMAKLGTGAHKSKDIAAAMMCRTSSLSRVREDLIRDGMIYSPSHGSLDFTVPLFNEFILRTMRKESDRIS